MTAKIVGKEHMISFLLEFSSHNLVESPSHPATKDRMEAMRKASNSPFILGQWVMIRLGCPDDEKIRKELEIIFFTLPSFCCVIACLFCELVSLLGTFSKDVFHHYIKS